MNTQLQRSTDEIARLGDEIRLRHVEPQLNPEDTGKYLAIDIDTEEFEIDENDLTAVSRLKARLPAADIFLARAGHRTLGRIGSSR